MQGTVTGKWAADTWGEHDSWQQAPRGTNRRVAFCSEKNVNCSHVPATHSHMMLSASCAQAFCSLPHLLLRLCKYDCARQALLLHQAVICFSKNLKQWKHLSVFNNGTRNVSTGSFGAFAIQGSEYLGTAPANPQCSLDNGW